MQEKYIQLVINVSVEEGRDAEQVLADLYYDVLGPGVEDYELVACSVENHATEQTPAR